MDNRAEYIIPEQVVENIIMQETDHTQKKLLRDFYAILMEKAQIKIGSSSANSKVINGKCKKVVGSLVNKVVARQLIDFFQSTHKEWDLLVELDDNDLIVEKLPNENIAPEVVFDLAEDVDKENLRKLYELIIICTEIINRKHITKVNTLKHPDLQGLLDEIESVAKMIKDPGDAEKLILSIENQNPGLRNAMKVIKANLLE